MSFTEDKTGLGTGATKKKNDKTYMIVVSPKSMGLAIVLTILFGSLGLFYASVTGGLVMTFAVPLAVMLLAVLGVGAGGLEGMILLAAADSCFGFCSAGS